MVEQTRCWFRGSMGDTGRATWLLNAIGVCVFCVLTMSNLDCTGEDVAIGHSNATVAGVDTEGVWTISHFPNPQTDPEKCGRDHPSYVCDPAHVLTTEEASLVDLQINLTCENTTCPCTSPCQLSCPGYSISVAMVTKITFLETNGDPDSEIRRWVNSLRVSQWNFGKCGEDVLIVISKDDSKAFSSIGNMARDVLPDACVQAIFAQATSHHFQYGNFGQGLLEMLRYLRLSIQNKSCIMSWRPRSMSKTLAENEDSVDKDEPKGGSASEAESSSSSGLSGAQIAGIVIGCVVGAAIILGLILYCCGCGDSDPESNAPYQVPTKENKQNKQNRPNVRYKPQRTHHGSSSGGGSGWTEYDTATAVGYVAAAVVIGGASDWGRDDGGGGGGSQDYGGGGDSGGGDFGD